MRIIEVPERTSLLQIPKPHGLETDLNPGPTDPKPVLFVQPGTSGMAAAFAWLGLLPQGGAEWDMGQAWGLWPAFLL